MEPAPSVSWFAFLVKLAAACVALVIAGMALTAAGDVARRVFRKRELEAIVPLALISLMVIVPTAIVAWSWLR
jgi:hypothetical protein